MRRGGFLLRKADAPAAEEPIDEPAAEEPADEPLPADEPPADEPPAAVAGEVDDGDDFLAGIEDELGLNTTAQKSETPADEPSQPANPSSDDDLSDVAPYRDDSKVRATLPDGRVIELERVHAVQAHLEMPTRKKEAQD